MKSKYQDGVAETQLIGCVLRDPTLLDDDGRYFFAPDGSDFTSDVRRVIFAAALNLHRLGAESLSSNAITEYLAPHPTSFGIFNASKGVEFIEEAKLNAELSNFDYNYERVKKFALLRGYENAGMKLDWLYDPDNILDSKERTRQEDFFNSLTIGKLADLVDNQVLEVRDKCVDNIVNDSVQIATGIEELIDNLSIEPELGAPMYGDIINTVTRGARRGKFYLRSGATGTGKTRMMMADACCFSCKELFNIKTQTWEKISDTQYPTLFISTELEMDELQTMSLGFLSGVNEEKILKGEMTFEETQRVKYAIKVLQESQLFIEVIPNFNIKTIENCIKRNARVNKVTFVCFDYINSSLGLLQEMASQTRGVNMREDNILFLLSTKLKELATSFNLFILSGTQLNASWKTDPLPDANLLKGAKSIAERVDWGSIVLNTTQDDEELLKPALEETGFEMPNTKLSIYKNRRGSYVQCFVWMKADKGTCRFDPLFITDWDYKIIPVAPTKINVRG